MPFVSKKFVDMMQFYACAETYKRRHIHPQGSKKRYRPAPIVFDHGGRARAALDDLHRYGLIARILRSFRPARRPTDPRAVSTPAPLNPQPSLEFIPAEFADTNEA